MSRLAEGENGEWSRGESNLRAGSLKDCSPSHSAPLKNPSGAESGAIGAMLVKDDSDLAAVVTAWPKLPDHIRQSIRTLVESSHQRIR